MTAGVIALLLGLFAAPAFLLWAGHHWRHTSPRMRGAFWGGITAHTVGAVAASIAGMVPAAEWAGSDIVRGFFGYWSMLVFFAVGALIGAMMAGGSPVRARGNAPQDGAGSGFVD